MMSSYKSEFDQKVEAINQSVQQPKQFLYNDKCLVKDVHGHPTSAWLQKCFSHLFTDHEIKTSQFVKNGYSGRSGLDETRLKLLHEALLYKYKYSEEQNEKLWKKLKNYANQRGRNISYTEREAFKRLSLNVQRHGNESDEEEKA
jgi:uncharacterized protein YecE (DUF72 family)